MRVATTKEWEVIPKGWIIEPHVSGRSLLNDTALVELAPTRYTSHDSRDQNRLVHQLLHDNSSYFESSRSWCLVYTSHSYTAHVSVRTAQTRTIILQFIRRFKLHQVGKQKGNSVQKSAPR